MASFFSLLDEKLLKPAKSLGLSAGKIGAVVLTAFFGLFVLLAFARFGFVYWIYSTVEGWTTARRGFDYYVSNLIAAAFTSVFSLLAPTLGWYIFLGKKQAAGVAVTVGVQLLICASIYSVGRGVCFDRKTGKPLCWFADTASGRIWSCTPDFDPASGQPFCLYTREINEVENAAAKNKTKK